MSINEYPSVVRWLNNLRQSSAETYLHYLKRFCDYARLNPDQLVEAAKKDSTAAHDTLKAFRCRATCGYTGDTGKAYTQPRSSGDML